MWIGAGHGRSGHALIGAIGLVIYEMHLGQSNLEDVFFGLTNTEGALT